MNAPLITRQIENAEAVKTTSVQNYDQERKTAFRKPCGHAAPVVSFATRPANLTTSAWATLRVVHMPTRPAAISWICLKGGTSVN